ncbi:MAG TPA: hypothetical protein VEV17_02560 [Bryobacteraceae bacterium]|nr:hypothetical protein [Bryobacteraceae bacterium]
MRIYVNISALALLGGMLVPHGAALASSGQSGHWQAPAQWHRLLKKAVPGTLALDDEGVEFRSAKFNQRWAYVDIHSFDLSARELTLTSYQNRPWHEPGERSFHFTWSEPMPAGMAVQFSEKVGKPVRNEVPLASVAALSEIPAHHRMWSGGSNGTLRLKESGIDYVTENGRDSRTWRWADIQTIANPTPYEFRVTAYREIVEFDLKQPLSRALFERMWDYLYAPGLNLSATGGHR